MPERRGHTFARAPFLRYAVFFAAGVGLHYHLESAPRWWYGLLASGLALYLAGHLLRLGKPHRRPWALVIVGSGFLLALMGLGGSYTYWRSPAAHPDFFLEKPLPDSARYALQLKSSPEQYRNSRGYRATCLGYHKQGRFTSLYGDLRLYVAHELPFRGQAGDTLWVARPPRPFRAKQFPGQFDYRATMRRKRLYGSIGLDSGDFFALRQKARRPWQPLQALRRQASALFPQADTLSPAQQVLQTVILGRKEQLSDSLRQQFSRAGVAHMLAVSGFHVGMVLLFLRYALGRWRRQYPLVFGLVVLAGIWAYALLTGFSPSIVRACLMFSFVQLGTMSQRQNAAFNSLSAAGLVLLVVEPLWLMNLGFQFSFAAVAGILYFYPRWSGYVAWNNLLAQRIWEVLLVSAAAQLALTPLILYYFGAFPLYFLPFNLVLALPIFALMALGLLSLLLAWLPFLSQVLPALTETAAELMVQIVRAVDRLPLATLHAPDWGLAEVLLSGALLVVGAWLLAERSFRAWAAAASLGVLALVWPLLVQLFDPPKVQYQLISYRGRAFAGLSKGAKTYRWPLSQPADSLPLRAYLQQNPALSNRQFLAEAQWPSGDSLPHFEGMEPFRWGGKRVLRLYNPFFPDSLPRSSPQDLLWVDTWGLDSSRWARLNKAFAPQKIVATYPTMAAALPANRGCYIIRNQGYYRYGPAQSGMP